MVKPTVDSGRPLQLKALTVPKGHYFGLGKQYILRNEDKHFGSEIRQPSGVS